MFYVNSASGFCDHAEVANGASDLIIGVMGEAGEHTRCSVGSISLPKNANVEITAVFELI